MEKALRQSTLETLGLGTVLGIFKRGGLPVETSDMVDRVFGPEADRGCMVISGANGIVGAGKTMQFASRLEPFGITIAALDFPGAPAGITKQYAGLASGFGKEQAAKIMNNVVQFTYDGKSLPRQLAAMKPRFLLEAVPEIVAIKKAHYETFRTAFPGIEIRSVTSGFPSKELGVGIAHPAFPHESNKVWEIVEQTPSAVTQLLWSMGMIPAMVSDDWSFVLDVIFCGAMQAACRYSEASNMPGWKVDKYLRQLLGPNPFRAHDAIGTKGASFLTWSCLEHLEQQYGPLFKPAAGLVDRKDSGLSWYPMNHLRPMVNWALDEAGEAELQAWILGPLFQMTSLMLHEKRAQLTQLNRIGELCAQFKNGVIAMARKLGTGKVLALVAAYHKLQPESASSPWYPEEFQQMDRPDWQQLYVNAEHDGKVGVITFSGESYSQEVDAELNRAMDWLQAEGIARVILSGDFHFSTQLAGVDMADFFPALERPEQGTALAMEWSLTARRLHDEFAITVGFVHGKRCLGAFFELFQHCHYLVAVDSADLGMPEVSLPVVPVMEGCHWFFRKAAPEAWPKVLAMLLEGRPVKAGKAVGWLADYAGPLDAAIKACWAIATGESPVPMRPVDASPLAGVPAEVPGLPAANAKVEAGRRAILDAVREACAAPLSEALTIQAGHAGRFLGHPSCKGGSIGAAFAKTAV